MKKASKIVALSLALSLASSGIIPAVNAIGAGPGKIEETNVSDSKVSRIYGSDRIETALKLADNFGKCPAIVLATANNYADALVSAPLAYYLTSPILLNNSGRLDPKVKQSIINHDTMTVYMVGGESSLSPAIEKELKSMGRNVRRIAGRDRYETSVKISKELGKIVKPDKVVIASGENFPDALVAGPYASNIMAPILLSTGKRVPDVVEKEVERINPSKVIGIGGMSSLNPGNIKLTERISGNNRYETSYNVAKLLDRSRVYVTNGLIFADALVAAPVAARTDSPILLREKYRVPANIQSLINEAKEVIIVGGPNSVSENTASGGVVTDKNIVNTDNNAVNDMIKPEQVRASLKDIEKKFNELINEHRRNNGAEPLEWEEKARDGSDLRAKELATLFSHTRPDGNTYNTVFKDLKNVGENIAFLSVKHGDKNNFANSIAEKLFDLWKNSPGHNANMLNKGAKEHMLGIYYDENKGNIYFANNFFNSEMDEDYGNIAGGSVATIEEVSNSLNDIETSLYKLINEYRVNNGLNPLTVEKNAREGANARAKEIVNVRGYFDGKSAYPNLGYINEFIANYSASVAEKNNVGNSMANILFKMFKSYPSINKMLLDERAKKNMLGIYYDKSRNSLYFSYEYFGEHENTATDENPAVNDKTDSNETVE